MKRFFLILLLVNLLGSCFKKNTSENSNRILKDQMPSSSPTKVKTPEPARSPTIQPENTPAPESKSIVVPQLTPALKSSCDSNYSGCVPIASDVDCAGGDGDGPEYVEGPIKVIGYDKYKLDRDGNGIACEQ